VTEESGPSRRRIGAWIGVVLLATGLVGVYLFARPSAEQFKEIRGALEQGGLLLDVRSEGEFESGHLEGAINIPVGELGDRLGEVGAKDRPLVVY